MDMRKLTAVLGALALTIGLTSTALATAPTGHQVTICHATDSNTNPYIQETVDIGSSGLLQGGHNDHTGPVWDATLKASHTQWGDIIPAYDYDTGDGIFHFDGLNVEAGAAILAAGCTIPEQPAHNPAIHVVKSADPGSLPAGGGPVEYTYVVTNTGNVDLTGVTVSDNKCSPLTGPTGDTGSDGVLGLTETWTYTCTTSLTETTTNTVTAIGHDGDTEVSDTDQATVTVAPAVNAPSIALDKTADPTTLPVGGGSITYTYVVTNTGNTALTNIVLTDDNGTPGDTGDDFTVVCPHDSLAVATQMTCTASVTGTTTTTTNIATVTAKFGETTVSAHDSATVTVTAPGGGVQGETSPPKVTAPPTDAIGGTSSDSGAGGSLPLLLIVMGIIGLGAVLLTPARNRR